MRNPNAPIVVDLGTASIKRIRQLKRGTGTLETEVRETVAQVREQLGADAQATELVPVVVIYSRKNRRQRSFIDLIL
jgi:hypothetical protein